MPIRPDATGPLVPASVLAMGLVWTLTSVPGLGLSLALMSGPVLGPVWALAWGLA